MALQEELKQQGDFLFKNRSYLPLLILGLGLLVHVLAALREIEGPETWFSESHEWICLGVCLLGLWIRIKTIGHTPKDTSGRNTTEGQIAQKLNTTGMYSIVRHPLYLGNFFMWLGVAMLTANLWFIVAFVLFYAFYYERIMYAEEAFLRNKFGDTYLNWANKVPSFIPSVSNYKNAEYRFNLKKVLKKEKNGFAAIFILFWVFEFAGDWAEERQPKLEFDFWSVAALSATFIYFVLKILKKQKRLESKDRLVK